MKFTEIASRLNGLTLGIFGAQWVAKPSDTEIARRVIRFLEDRRILYNDCAHEEPAHCVESVLEIRRVLTQEIGNLGENSDLLVPLRAMRAACRKFLDDMQWDNDRRVRLHHEWEANRFYSTLGEFRGAIGPHVATLAACYSVDIEGDLARVLPFEDSGG
jgi:hypothetical protein